LTQFHQKLIFQGKFPKTIDFFQVISQKFLIFQGKFLKNFDFLGNFTENFDLPGNNWLFTAISGQIILFLFKSHHFRTYFLCMIRYNNILRPVHDPMTPLRPPRSLCPKSGGLRPPTPRIDAYVNGERKKKPMSRPKCMICPNLSIAKQAMVPNKL